MNDLYPLSDFINLFTSTNSSVVKHSIGNCLGFQATPTTDNSKLS